MELDWLESLNRYYAAVLSPQKRLSGQNAFVSKTYYYLPWWRAAVESKSEAGWRIIKKLREAPQPWRLQAKILLTDLAKIPPGRIFLPHLKIKNLEGVEPWDIAFLGRGRHKVVLMSFAKKEVLHLRRNQGTSAPLMKEIEIRNQYQHVITTPRLLLLDPHGDYFSEQLIEGRPLYLLNLHEADEALNQVFSQLWNYYVERGITNKSYLHYLEEKIQNVERLAAQAPASVQSLLKGGTQSLRRRMLQTVDFTIQLAHSHGDLHFANLMKEGEKTYLMDWELSGVRTLYYDWFNLRAIGVRNFKQSFNALGLDPDYPSRGEMIRHPDFFRELISKAKIYGLLYVMERLEFELEKPMDLPWLHGWADDFLLKVKHAGF